MITSQSAQGLLRVRGSPDSPRVGVPLPQAEAKTRRLRVASRRTGWERRASRRWMVLALLASALAGRGPVAEDRESRDLLLYLVGEKKVPLGKAWRTIRGASEIWLINTFNLTRATVPEVLVHATLPASHVMQRLRSEGVELLPYQTESGLEEPTS